MAPNEMKIIVYPKKFEVKPPCAEAVSGRGAPLVVSVDWNNNGGMWDSVRLKSFTRPDGSSIQTDPAELYFLAGDTEPQAIGFPYREGQDVYCKCLLEYVQHSDASLWVVDPTIILKR